MRVLLIQPPIEDFYTTPIRLYPLGLLYAARVLMALGVEVGVLDCLTPLKKRQLPIPETFAYLKPFIRAEPLLFQHYYRFGMPTDRILEAVDRFGPDWIGMAAQFTAYFSGVARLAGRIKDHCRVPIFVGGNHATVFADQIRARAPSIDRVMIGPAERSLPPFVQALGRGRGRGCGGALDWRDLHPAHELLDGDAYRIGRKNAISLTASRGCPFACDFCSVRAMFGTGIHYRPVAHVTQEMRANVMAKGVRVLNFEDDNIAADRTWFAALLDAVAGDPVFDGVELTAMNGIGYTLLDEPLLDRMAAAGFRQLNLSYVTRDAVLRAHHGRPGGRRLEPVVAAARKLGLFVTVYVMIGLPGQTVDEVRGSIDALVDLGVLVGPSIFYIPPGSRLFPRLNLPPEVAGNWDLYRSSAFALETPHLTRSDLVDLFVHARRRNLARKPGGPDPRGQTRGLDGESPGE